LLPEIVHLARHPSLRRSALVAAGATSLTLPVVNALLLTVLTRLPVVGGSALNLAGPLTAIQPLGYLVLLVLAIKHDAPWKGWLAGERTRGRPPGTKSVGFTLPAVSPSNGRAVRID